MTGGVGSKQNELRAVDRMGSNAQKIFLGVEIPSTKSKPHRKSRTMRIFSVVSRFST